MLTQADLASYVTYNPITLRRETTLTEVVQTLIDTGIHHWPVVDDDMQLVGVFSDRDLLKTLRTTAAEPVAAGCLSANPPSPTLTVQDILADAIEFASIETSPRTVLGQLLDLEIDWLPVLQDGTLVGVTTFSDFLRDFSYGRFGVSKTQISAAMEPVDFICGEATLNDACEALRQQPADCLGIVRGDFPLGVLSARDVRMAMCRVAVADWLDETAGGDNLHGKGSRTLLELVSAAPTIRPGERLQDAATLMLDHNRQAIAVVNQANRMMGAVVERGILRRMHSCLI